MPVGSGRKPPGWGTSVTDVFISYDKRDHEIATALARFLEQSGFIVWWDTQLVGGETFRDAIERQLNSAKAVIVIWTANSIQSKWVISEAEHASKNGKLIPLRSADLPPQSIPMPFSQWQTDNFENRPLIISALKRLGVEPRYAPAAGGSLHDRFWKEIENSEHPEDFELYLKEFPEGPQVSYAKLKLARLFRVTKTSPIAVPVPEIPPTTAAGPAGGGTMGRIAGAAFWLTALGAIGAGGAWQFKELSAQLVGMRDELAKTQSETFRPRLEDDADWARSDAASLVRDWQGYLARRPVGLHATEADSRIGKRLAEGRLIAKLEAHDDAVLRLELEPDGIHLTSRGENGQVVAWDLAKKAAERQSRGERLKKTVVLSGTGQVGGSAAIPLSGLTENQGSQASISSYNNQYTLSMNTAEKGVTLSTLVPSSSGSVAVAILSDLALLSFTDGYNKERKVARLIERAARHREVDPELDPSLPFQLTTAVKLTERHILLGLDRTIYVLDRATGRHVVTLYGHTAPIRAMEMSPDGTRIVSAGDDRSVRLWDVSDLTSKAKS